MRDDYLFQNVPEIVRVVPHEDYTVTIYFSDGKITTYDARPKLEQGVFQSLKITWPCFLHYPKVSAPKI